MKIVVVLIMSVALVVSAASASASIAKVQVESRALSLSDMPSGWSVENTSDSSSTIPCLKSIKSPTKHQEKASVAYQQDGSLPAVQEVIATGRGVSASYKKINHALADCKSFTYSSGGQKVAGTIAPLSFPNVGTTSNAYAVSLIVQGASAGIDIVLFKSGRYVGAVLYESVGTPDPTQAQAFVNEAISKVEGEPVVVPTTV